MNNKDLIKENTKCELFYETSCSCGYCCMDG